MLNPKQITAAKRQSRSLQSFNIRPSRANRSSSNVRSTCRSAVHTPVIGRSKPQRLSTKKPNLNGKNLTTCIPRCLNLCECQCMNMPEIQGCEWRYPPSIPEIIVGRMCFPSTRGLSSTGARSCNHPQNSSCIGEAIIFWATSVPDRPKLFSTAEF